MASQWPVNGQSMASQWPINGQSMASPSMAIRIAVESQRIVSEGRGGRRNVLVLLMSRSTFM
eukprot:4082002-Lingulodinium_polyedra.AAC.1